MQELEQIVQEMINAGYSREKIEEVILFYNEKYVQDQINENPKTSEDVLSKSKL